MERKVYDYTKDFVNSLEIVKKKLPDLVFLFTF